MYNLSCSVHNYNHTHSFVLFMTICSPAMYTILDEEFDIDELNDIVNHGMSAGVSGFIYTSELLDKYTEFKNEIMDDLDEYCEDNFAQSAYSYIAEQLNFDSNDWGEQQFIEHAVWMYVEMRAWFYVNGYDND